MGNGSRKENENMYFRARKNASLCNDRLTSREKAAELLGVSESTLADYELGTTKIVPPDRVVRMADMYHSPELKNWYCKNECPIGEAMPLAIDDVGIDKAVLRIVHDFSHERIDSFRKELLEVVIDGKIDPDEEPILRMLKGWIHDMEFSLSELKISLGKILN